MKHKFNKLILVKKYIEYTFKTTLPKSELPIYNQYYWYNNLPNLKCYKLKQLLGKIIVWENIQQIYTYKIVIDYKFDNIVTLILNDIRNILISKNITLQISNNKCENLIKILSKLNCFETIIFSKNFSTTKYSYIKNMLGVKTIIYKGFWNHYLKDLPSNLNIIKINIKSNTNNLLLVPDKTNKIYIEEKFTERVYILNLENFIDFIQINRILLILNSNPILNLFDLKFEYLAYYARNESIDFVNLPNCIEILELGSCFNESLDYLSNNIKKIIIDSNSNPNMINLPSSIKEIYLKNLTFTNVNDLINKLPNFIETLNISLKNQRISHSRNMLDKIDELHLFR